MRGLTATAAFFLALASGGGALAQDVTGNYAGAFTASKPPGQQINIGIFFRQYPSGPNPNLVTGSFSTGLGDSGNCAGVLNGNSATITCSNTNTTCAGFTRGDYTFNASGVTWSYSGYDCRGGQTGSGTANRLAS